MNVADCTPETVFNLFSSLFPVEVEITPCSNTDHSSSEKVFGVYRNDDGALVAVCQADLDFAVWAAGALTMIPAGGCEDAIAENELTGSLHENAREVMNLLSTIISTHNGKRSFLDEFLATSDSVPEDVNTLLASSGESISLNIEFQRYGSGVITFYS